MNIISFEELKTCKNASLIVRYYIGWSGFSNYKKTIPVEEYLDFKVIKIEDSEIFIEFNKATIFSHGNGHTLKLKDHVINKNGYIAYILDGQKSYWHFNKPKWILLFTGKFDIDNIPNLHSQSKLFTYIYFNDYNRFVGEVNNGANINEENDEGLTPFGLSLYQADKKIAECLFKNVNIKLEHLRIALVMQNEKMFKMILDKIVVSETDLDYIFFSCLRYDHEYYKMIISKAHNIGYNHLLENPRTINYVINKNFYNYVDMIFIERLESLLQYGMKVNDLTILMKAKSDTNYNAIKLILKYKACDINKAIDTNGNTNLHVAFQLMDGSEYLQKIIDLLQENEANPYKNNNNGIKPIHYTKENQECAICFEKDGKKEITKCKHYFHLKCLSEWLKNNNTCPLCRTQL